MIRAISILLLAGLLSGCAASGNGLIGSAGVSRGSWTEIAPDGTRRVVEVGR